MKRVIALLLAAVMIMSLAACGSKEEPNAGYPTMLGNRIHYGADGVHLVPGCD